METNTETISYLKLHLNFNEHDCATRTGYFMCVHLTILNINVFHIIIYSKTCLLQTQILQINEYNEANLLGSGTSPSSSLPVCSNYR